LVDAAKPTEAMTWTCIITGVDPVTAFVLAGGKSSRMGEDKAFLQLGSRTLLDHALELARAAGGRAWIVGSSGRFAAFGPVVEDVFADRGPLGGIHAALTQTVTDLNLMLAVDLPFLHLRLLNYLIAEARESAAVVVVPKVGEYLQPLCAVYRRSFRHVAEQSLRAGRNKIDGLFAEVPTRVIEPEELRQSGFAEEMFRNLNTQQDWEDARMRFAGKLG
jgi:molybdenum cofactor guanylyltransferase